MKCIYISFIKKVKFKKRLFLKLMRKWSLTPCIIDSWQEYKLYYILGNACMNQHSGKMSNIVALLNEIINVFSALPK